MLHYNKANPVIAPISEFWVNPEQYAFAIMDDDLVTEDNDPPWGAYLFLDNFQMIPEASATPWVFALSALGFACLRRLGR